MKSTADLWRDLNEMARPLLNEIATQTSRVWCGHKAQRLALRYIRRELNAALKVTERLLGGPYEALLDDQNDEAAANLIADRALHDWTTRTHNGDRLAKDVAQVIGDARREATELAAREAELAGRILNGVDPTCAKLIADAIRAQHAVKEHQPK